MEGGIEERGVLKGRDEREWRGRRNILGRNLNYEVFPPHLIHYFSLPSDACPLRSFLRLVFFFGFYVYPNQEETPLKKPIGDFFFFSPFLILCGLMSNGN